MHLVAMTLDNSKPRYLEPVFMSIECSRYLYIFFRTRCQLIGCREIYSVPPGGAVLFAMGRGARPGVAKSDPKI